MIAEWALTTADFKKAAEKGIADYGNHKMFNNKRVSLYRCKWDAIEIATRNKLLKYLDEDCTKHPALNIDTHKFNKRAFCIICMGEIAQYIKEGR